MQSTGLILAPTAPKLVLDPDKLFEPSGLVRLSTFNSESDSRMLSAFICSCILLVPSACSTNDSFFLAHCTHRLDLMEFKKVQAVQIHLFMGESVLVDVPHAVKLD